MEPLTVTLMGGPDEGRQLHGLDWRYVAPGQRLPVLGVMGRAVGLLPIVWTVPGYYELAITPTGWCGYWRNAQPGGRV